MRQAVEIEDDLDGVAIWLDNTLSLDRHIGVDVLFDIGSGTIGSDAARRAKAAAFRLGRLIWLKRLHGKARL
jgi:hypothetical protein